jgi:hypothetical protein
MEHHYVTMKVKLAGYKSEAESHGDHFYQQLGCGVPQVSPCMMTSTFHIEVLKCLRDSVQWKSQEKGSNNWIFHCDSVPCHASLVVQQFMMKNQIPVNPSHLVPEIM